MHNWCYGIHQFELQQYLMISEGFALKHEETLQMLWMRGDDCCWALGGGVTLKRGLLECRLLLTTKLV